MYQRGKIILYFIIILIIDAALAFIPANIAKNKGYSFGLWWLFGFLLWIVALIVSLVIQDKNAQQMPI